MGKVILFCCLPQSFDDQLRILMFYKIQHGYSDSFEGHHKNSGALYGCTVSPIK